MSNCRYVSAQRIEKGVRAFGAGRFLLGSDTPYGRDVLVGTMARVAGCRCMSGSGI